MSYAHIGDLQTWGLIDFTSWRFEAHDKYDDAYPRSQNLPLHKWRVITYMQRKEHSRNKSIDDW